MSNRYVLEPPTTGKVILKTSHGEVHVELWAREAPLACRNFVQLCLEGHYDNSPFYRVVPGFLVQAGPEDADESIFGSGFKDEHHSRLKFSHRGIVAMASSKPNDNKSHFFITTDKAEYLNRKHTIFGKVANNTLYNVLRIAEVEVGPNDRPIMLPKIMSAEIIVNPFDDIVPRERKKTVEIKAQGEMQKNKVHRTLISYDDEEEEGEIGKIKSSHDMLDDERLGKEVEKEPEIEKNYQKLKSEVKKGKRHSSGSDEDFDMKMKKKILAQREITVEETNKAPLKIGNYTVTFDQGKSVLTKETDPNEEFKNLKSNLLMLKKKPMGSNNLSMKAEEKQEETFLSPLQKLKYNFYQYNKKTKGREQETLSKLDNFVGKLKTDDEKQSWFANKLKFSIDSTRAFAFNKDLPSKPPASDDDDYAPIADPKKRLKRFEDESEDIKGLKQVLSYENLMKISHSPKPE
jgi:peptidyl-prolyl cis-trans isomerase SDCCAG10